MTLRNTSIALATIIAALAAVSVVDTASARFGTVAPDDAAVRTELRRMPRPAPNTTTRPSNRGMRGTPNIGDRGMRGGGRRMNDGMGRR